MSENLNNSFLSLFDSHFIDEKRDIHKVKINAIDTLYQNIMNEERISDEDFRHKWSYIEKLNSLEKSRNLFNIFKRTFQIEKNFENENFSLGNISSDWLLDFMDKAKNISDNDFSKIWSEILRTEAEYPGKIPKKLLNVLYLMDKEDVTNILFFSRYCFADGDKKNKSLYHPIMFLKDDYAHYVTFGIKNELLENLENLGLIICDYESGYYFSKKKKFFYEDKYIEVIADSKIKAGNVKLTNIGQALMNFINVEHSDTILKYTLEKWVENGYIIQVNNEFFPRV